MESGVKALPEAFPVPCFRGFRFYLRLTLSFEDKVRHKRGMVGYKP